MTKFSVQSFSGNRWHVYWVVLVAAIGLLLPQVGQAQYGTAGDQVQYPGLMPPSAKVETTLGPLKVRPYGTFLMNISVSDTRVIGQDIPLWSATDSGTVTFPDGSTRRTTLFPGSANAPVIRSIKRVWLSRVP